MPSIPALIFSPMWHLLSCTAKILCPVLFNPLNEHRILLSSPVEAFVLSSFNLFPPLPDSMNCSSRKTLTNLSPLLPQLPVRFHQSFVFLSTKRTLLDPWLEAVMPSSPALSYSPVWQLFPDQLCPN